jgi:FixJ family two-component response regulator
MVVHVVDDDEDVRGGFTRLLRSAGLQVRAYASAAQFLDQVDNSGSGCILLDVTMPGITGPEALVHLKEKCNSLPVIIVSARDSEAVHKLVRALGAKMFLRKPVDDQALLDAISWVTTVRADH